MSAPSSAEPAGSPAAGSRGGTLRPARKFQEGSRLGTLQKALNDGKYRSLGSENVREMILAPDGVSEEEWLSVKVIETFNELNMLTGALSDEICTDKSCPVMGAGDVEYHWADGVNVIEPLRVSAPQYFEYLMHWADACIADENLMPTKEGVPFPKHFGKSIRTIFKRFFRVYAHIYHKHFKELVEADIDAHLMSSFKPFCFLCKEFNLVKEEELRSVNGMEEFMDWLFKREQEAEEKAGLCPPCLPSAAASPPAAAANPSPAATESTSSS